VRQGLTALTLLGCRFGVHNLIVWLVTCDDEKS
jgi:hypothetical protein